MIRCDVIAGKTNGSGLFVAGERDMAYVQYLILKNRGLLELYAPCYLADGGGLDDYVDEAVDMIPQSIGTDLCADPQWVLCPVGAVLGVTMVSLPEDPDYPGVLNTRAYYSVFVDGKPALLTDLLLDKRLILGYVAPSDYPRSREEVALGIVDLMWWSREKLKELA